MACSGAAAHAARGAGPCAKERGRGSPYSAPSSGARLRAAGAREEAAPEAVQREEEERLWRADAARRPATPEGWTPPADGGESDGWSD